MKKIVLSIIMILALLLSWKGVARAAEKYTSTSIINGKTINWEYEINDSNKIENLVCKNPSDIIGELIIPDVIDGKNVLSVGEDAFSYGENIESVVIKGSIETINLRAFQGCSNIKRVDLGNVKSINSPFDGCESLEEVFIPKTVISGSFYGCSNLKKVEFEEGMTRIPNSICYKVPIESVNLPSTVDTIGDGAFSNCDKLKKIDLTGIKTVEAFAFKNCKELNELILPENILICSQAFDGCESLTEIKIPKTIFPSAPIMEGYFTNCPNLKNVTFEDGTKKISPILSCSDVEEIVIPNSVNTIESYSFYNTKKLKKITILKNVEIMESDTGEEEIFQNHDPELTIYCNRNSVAAEYAIKHNIKYVYVDEEENSAKDDKDNSKSDPTIAPTPIPQTGQSIMVALGIVSVIGLGVYTYRRLKNYRDVI